MLEILAEFSAFVVVASMIWVTMKLLHEKLSGEDD